MMHPDMMLPELSFPELPQSALPDECCDVSESSCEGGGIIWGAVKEQVLKYGIPGLAVWNALDGAFWYVSSNEFIAWLVRNEIFAKTDFIDYLHGNKILAGGLAAGVAILTNIQFYIMLWMIHLKTKGVFDEEEMVKIKYEK